MKNLCYPRIYATPIKHSVCLNSILNVKAQVGTFNQEKALVGAFSVIVKTGCGTDGSICGTSEHVANPVLVSGARNDYLLAIQTANAHQSQYYHTWLQKCLAGQWRSCT